ncbi:hypothetical protein C1H71_07585 [Iodobacter fluviatilis]|uniref:Archaeal ATPase n=1 Tax=Iodobacter fluviatilis TaxID=537 RepID=A0A7G3GEQ0_9NEIS|nr:hypothetical protein C1H71_07585 [Iodobacter fluviatilis]
MVDKRSGLFLTAKRRVGKTTFLREDLLPEAKQRGWLAVYIDLWSDRSRDPAELIADVVKEAIYQESGAVAKAAKSTGLSKFSVAGFSFDFQAIGLPEGMTLFQGLQLLQQLTKKPILLIVDEAQHALISKEGEASMFALKAARDGMNNSNDAPKLMLVFTGSNRDKLAHLVMSSKMPFFGSSVMDFPMLSREFTDGYTAHINKSLASDNQLDPNAVWDTFQLVGYRPEFLRSIISDVALEMQSAPDLNQKIQAGGTVLQSRIWTEIENEYTSLSALQQAIIRVMSIQHGQFSPFSASSMAEYGAVAQGLSTGSIQTALDALRERGIVWKESRGAYELEDESWNTWLKMKNIVQ